MIRRQFVVAGLFASACGRKEGLDEAVGGAASAARAQVSGDPRHPTAASMPSSGVPRVAFLALGVKDAPAISSPMPAEQLFRARLAELGYVDGTTVRIEERYANGDMQRLDALAREIVESRPDVIVTIAASATLAAHRATTTIPIVMAHAGDPVRAGLAATLARPGGNVTGTTSMVSDLGAKQIQHLLQVVPRLRRLGVVMNGANPGHRAQLANMDEAARGANIDLIVTEVERQADFDGALGTLRGAHLDAVFIMIEPMIFQNRARLLEFVDMERLPASTDVGRILVHEGALMSYGPVLSGHNALVAEYVDRILRGTSPAELPIQQPTQFALVINLKTAKALGLNIPQALLLRADEIVQ